MYKFFRFLLTLNLLSLLALGLPRVVSAQTEVPQIRITQVDNSKFPQVTVYVSVTNSAGEPVGVDPAIIQIAENGALMQPSNVQGSGAGDAGTLTTMLVMDISGSMDKNDKLTAAKDAAKAYVAQMRAGDQAGLITFDTQTYYVQQITTDTAALTSAIDGLRTGSDTAMYNALIEAEKALEGVSGRKTIIALTDGLDNRSQNTADNVIEGIGPSGLTISTIGFGDASTASQSGLDEVALSSLAERSGGLYSFAADAQALSALYQQYGRALQNEYAVTYISPSTLRDGVNRGLTVSLTGSAVSTEGKYNPGGVLPEVSGKSWTLFGIILLGLALLLVVPMLISRGAQAFSGMNRSSPGKPVNRSSQPVRGRIKLK